LIEQQHPKVIESYTHNTLILLTVKAPITDMLQKSWV
jgi:hypothetical protein